MIDKNIYKVGDMVKIMSRSSRHNGLCGVIERVLYKVRFDDGSDSAFVEDSLSKFEDFSQESKDELKDLSKRVENIENQMKKDKEEQLERLKAEIEYAKFRYALIGGEE